MSERIYRVDKFVVPTSAREEFLDRVRRTHALLKAQPGFVQDSVLEQFSGPGEFNVVTTVEWASQEAFESASAVVTARYQRNEFQPAGDTCSPGHKGRSRKL
jgi:heme-degrading monooxygenase HmoA